jgi:hypothetical protein
MSMAIPVTRAKFRVQTVTPQDYTDKEGKTVKYSETWDLYPVYSPDPADENHHFWTASPSGNLRLQVNNPECFGEEYYVDFTRAPQTPPVTP